MSILNTTARETLIAIYLDWVNDYLTTEKFAACNDLTDDQACRLINLAREVFNSAHPDE